MTTTDVRILHTHTGSGPDVQEAGGRLLPHAAGSGSVGRLTWGGAAHHERRRPFWESILPRTVRARIAIEAGIVVGWEHYVGLDGTTVGMTGFGASAPGPTVYKRFGFTKENVITQAKELLARQ